MAGLYWPVIALWAIPNHSLTGAIADWAVAIVVFNTLFVLPAGMVEWLLARSRAGAVLLDDIGFCKD